MTYIDMNTEAEMSVAEYDQRIADLIKARDQVVAKRKNDAINQIKSLVEEFGIVASDIFREISSSATPKKKSIRSQKEKLEDKRQKALDALRSGKQVWKNDDKIYLAGQKGAKPSWIHDDFLVSDPSDLQ